MEEPKKETDKIKEEIEQKGKHEKEQITKKRNWLNITFWICLIVFLFSGYKILKYNIDAQTNKKLLEKISKSIIIDETVEDITYENIDKFVEAKEENAESEDSTVKSRYKIDFDTLKKENLDTVGFLKVRGTDIEFIVVQTVDNDYYLTHNFEKNSNRAGWIFADYRNELDGSDKNIVIYGHNMLNGSMFSTLSNVLEKEWLEDINNRFITFITEDGTSIYEVFAVYQIPDDDYYTQTNFSKGSFNEYINRALQKSIYNFETTVNSEDQLLTLITCGRSNSQRIVINAKKLN